MTNNDSGATDLDQKNLCMNIAGSVPMSMKPLGIMQVKCKVDSDFS